MHILDAYGSSYKEIEKDGFKISDKIYMALDGYNNFTMAKSMGVLINSFVDILMRVKPDWLILAGDRSETLSAAIAASYCYIPVAHIQAGELSGNIDGLARHAIGKFSHLHFASNKDAEVRLKKLGEQNFRIKKVGAPQLDDLLGIIKKNLSRKKTLKQLGFDEDFDYFLVVYHPVTEEFTKVKKNFIELTNALVKFNKKKIWVLPNNDAGSQVIRHELDMRKDSENYIYSNLKREVYLNILKNSDAIIGNSSSGIIESSSFMVPCVNIGRRQHMRFRAGNVIDEYDVKAKKIINAINKSQSKNFIKKIKKIKNPYGNFDASEKIIKILEKTKIDDKLLIKSLTY